MSERDLEEEYFAREDREKLAKLRAQVEAESAAAHTAELRALHHHRCGKCGNGMETRPFRGLEIEVCVACGAVLLDPGELETLAGEDKAGVMRGLLNFLGK